MTIRNLLVGLLLIGVVSSCKKEATTENPNAEKTTLNVGYGSDPLQTMDIYLPEGRSTSTTKVIVMIHGGAWVGGDKTDLTPFVTTVKLKQPGYAIFNINYRLSATPINIFPTQELDVLKAVSFIHDHEAEYGISEKYVLMGASAGAHLALLQAYKYSTPVKAKAVISFSGPTDMLDMYNHPAGGLPILSAALAVAIGKTPVEDSMLYVNSSPTHFVDNTVPPTLLLQGSVDGLVSNAQPELLKAKLDAAGVANQYVLYPGEAHIDTWSSATLDDSFNKIQAFLALHVQ